MRHTLGDPHFVSLVASLLFATLIAAGNAPVRGDELIEQAAADDHTALLRDFPVAIRVDARTQIGPLRPIWRFFGADEPNYATKKYGRKLLAELGELRAHAAAGRGSVYFRAHNLLTSGDGTPALKWGSTNAYRDDAEGNPVYDWTILDEIFDAYISCGVRPLVEIGFMPTDLSIQPEPYRHHWTATDPYHKIFTGWSYPPKDYQKWADLVHAWAKHCVERYGAEEVAAWYWETWNEANTGYWRGTPEEFHQLHDFAIDAVRRALPTAQVGGPHTAGGGGEFLRDFLSHCLRGKNHATGRTGTPLDFVAFHAKGAPKSVSVVRGSPDPAPPGTSGSVGRPATTYVRMGIAEQLRTIDEAMKIVASFPELKRTPIIIGESDPEGCAACQGPQLAYRNGTMYSSYTAASFARKHELADRHGVILEGALTWAFEFEDQPYFAGFRSLATNGIDKPVLNVFRMFAKMSGDRLEVDSGGAVPLETILRRGVRETADVSALASLDGGRLCVLVWHYHDDDLSGPAADVTLSISNLPSGGGDVHMEHYRIDAEHSNAYAVWNRMGSPQDPTPRQYADLERAGQLTRLGPTEALEVNIGVATVDFSLPRQGVSLLVVTWGSSSE
jgi:xylan 1,4-beta-xylosidase